MGERDLSLVSTTGGIEKRKMRRVRRKKGYLPRREREISAV
jgi:hypothetical protein